MPEVDPNAPVETPPVVPSPLGVDPTPTPPATPVVPAPVAPAAPAPTQVTIPQDQYQALLDRNSMLSLIEKDPQLSANVRDHFKARTADTGEPSLEANGDIGKQLADLRAENKELKDTLTTAVANIQVDNFKRTHDDFDNYRQEMATLNQKYPGMELEDLYQTAKARVQAEKAQAPQPTPQPTPTVATSETDGVGELPGADPGSKEDILARAAAVINDPKATRSIEEAFDIAAKAAQAVSDVEE